jgi:uncharacterized protein YhaN
LTPCAGQETLAQAISRARALIDQTKNAATSHKVLARKQKNAEEKLAEAARQITERKGDWQAWQANWAESMAAIRLAGDAVGEEASARLGQFAELEKALDSLDGARADCAAAQVTLTRVEQDTARLLAATRFDRANKPIDAVIETLYEQLRQAKQLAQQRQTLEDMVKEASKAGERADQAMRLATEELDRLKAAAGCATLPEILEAENRSAEHLRLETELAAIETRLVTASALPLPELLVQAEGQDLALVQAALHRASDDLVDCTTQVEALHGKVIAAEGALGRVDGESVAADAEQRASDASARLSNLVADYASARLASTILTDVIESYQQRFQGPLLARASELFATITGGRFEKVATDFDEDLSILVGVRPNGRRERVGNLSSGTRDQLFLALRLAAIEKHVSNQEPMPVVVDDIVINFDDTSASATFQVLADLSKKTQVLFFTHHEHLLERAAKAIGKDAFAAHNL